ncbi:MAG: response regulator transcription factor [Muribaculaceae bacterium]|nr:response regulator transcription factor [Muribaculaceae bacterium]
MEIIIADNQDITYAGLKHILSEMGWKRSMRVANRRELMAELLVNSNALVIIDYSLFDFPDIEMLLIANSRFENVRWLLIGDEFSNDILNRLIVNERDFGAIYKNAPKSEIITALESSLNGKRYVSQDSLEAIISIKRPKDNEEFSPLTPTEREILILIAQGRTSKEIADTRYSSVNTIVTHRKNIFRKIKVNNVYEATRYALRIGLISPSEYYI